MMRRSIYWITWVLAGMALLPPGNVFAGWETGAKAGFETNVNRSVVDGESDTYLLGYGAYLRRGDGEHRLDWTFSAMLEGAAYAKADGMDYGSVSLAPGAICVVRPGWVINISPFLQAKTVRDTDQSSLAFGARADLRQEFREKLYLGEFFSYIDSRANVDTYSYSEVAAGALFGVNWTSATFTEIGYRYSHGDSFLSVGTVSSSSGGGGGGPGFQGGSSPRFSSTFGNDVVKDLVGTHAVEISAGIDWTRALFSVANFAWQATRGDVGTASSLSGYAGIGYRF
ncbi:MAG: hypothetical protein WBM29_06910 [Candidatus Deferrimicrobium sp.]